MDIPSNWGDGSNYICCCLSEYVIVTFCTTCNMFNNFFLMRPGVNHFKSLENNKVCTICKHFSLV